MEHDHQLRIVVEGAKAVWRLKEGRQLHWVEHLRARHEDRRRTLAELLAAVPSVCVVHVVLDKTALTPNSYLAKEQAGAYNYALRYLLERVAYAADQWIGGARIADVSLGLVGGVDDRETMRYLNHVATHERGDCPVGCAPMADEVSGDLRTSGTTSGRCLFRDAVGGAGARGPAVVRSGSPPDLSQRSRPDPRLWHQGNTKVRRGRASASV